MLTFNFSYSAISADLSISKVTFQSAIPAIRGSFRSRCNLIQWLLFVCYLFAIAPAFAAEEPIELATSSGFIKGTLTLPPTSSTRFPVVLMIAGSGPTDRDGNSPLLAGKNDSLKMLAAVLSDNGIASVRYDKRGVAESASAATSEAELRFEDYVNDAAAWVEKLANDSRFTAVAILGHSEGSLIGMLTAQRSPSKAFISVAGPAESAPDLLRRQLAGRLTPELAIRNEQILRALESGNTVSDVPPALLPLYRPNVQPYLISWFKYTPAHELAKLQTPCLVLQGGTDIQVSVADAIALQASNPLCAIKIINGMNHIMKSVPADRQKQIASYGDPSLPIDAAFVEALTSFFSSEKVRSALGVLR